MLKRAKQLIPFLTVAFFAVLAAGFLTRAPAFASEGAIAAQLQTEDAKFASDTYIPFYRIPATAFDYECNGGGAIGNAFDGDFSTYWTSTAQNTRTDKNEEGSFTNEVTVTFKTPVQVEAILYQCSPERGGTHGYPQTLELFASEDDSEPLSLGTCKSTPVSSRVLFSLPEVKRVKKLRFVFVQPNTAHNWVATAREIAFLEPQSDEVDGLGSLFSDYARTVLSGGVTSDSIEEMRASLQDRAAYASGIAPLLDRAEGVADERIVKDPAREFSTAQSAKNRIERNGDIRNYCKDVLKFSSFGIDYQPTGIAAVKDTAITVYVDAAEGDPLPSLLFTQTFNIWESWSRSVPLARGVNTFTVPDFVTPNLAKYTVHPEMQEVQDPDGTKHKEPVRTLTAGGAIYIVDPYTEKEQSASVKIYIEGGVFYPIYREGGDKQAFLDSVRAYCDNMEREPQNYPDVAELVSQRVIASSLAGSAKELFVDGGNDPEASCKGWNSFMESLLSFGGVALEAGEAHYQPINDHIRHNVRVVQPWAGALAYATGGFCGFCVGDYRDSFALLRYGTYGWGMAHELGHALDNNMGDKGRTTAEITNNMWSIFNRVAIEKNPEERYSTETFRSELAPDAEPAMKTYEAHRGTGYVFWWQIESRYNGFWGRVENLYRYHDLDADFAAAGVTAEEQKALTQEERHAYLCSLAAETDLTYYFDRWGFFFATQTVGEGEDARIVGKTPFDVDTLSPAYRKLMDRARGQGNFPLPQLKFWYTDYENYPYIAGGGKGIYTEQSKVGIRSVFTTEEGTTLVLPVETRAAHLGYEICEGGEVIGFTGGSSFTDTRTYPAGYVPVYTVRAYDRTLAASALSAPVSVAPTAGTEAPVCRIGETEFSSLADAVAAASGGETVTLLRDFALKRLKIEKDIVLEAEGVRTVRRADVGNLITVEKGATLTLRGDAGGLVFDGNSFSQSGAFVRVDLGGYLLSSGNVVFRNCMGTGEGGAIHASGSIRLVGTTFEGNSAKNGGAVRISDNAKGHVLEDCVFEKNVAVKYGGALCNVSAVNVVRCVFAYNSAESGGAVANVGGGVVWDLDSCGFRYNTASSAGGALWSDGNVRINGGAFVGNGAEKGGAVALVPSANQGSRTVTVTGAKFKCNDASRGGALYVANGGNLTVASAAMAGNTAELGGVLFAEKGTVTLPAQFTETEDFAAGTILLNGAPTPALPSSCTAGDYLDIGGTAQYYVDFGDVVQRKNGGEELILPAYDRAEEGTVFRGWLVNGEFHAAGERLTVDRDLYLAPCFGREFRIVYDSLGTTRAETVNEGDLLVLPEAAPPEGMRFEGWRSGGTLYGAGALLYAEADATFEAVFTEIAQDGPSAGVSPLLIAGIVVLCAGIAAMAAVFVWRLVAKKRG